MATLTKLDRVKYNFGSTTKLLADGDRVLLESGGAISYADLLAQLNADIAVSGGGRTYTNVSMTEDLDLTGTEEPNTDYFIFVTGGTAITMPTAIDSTCVYHVINQTNNRIRVSGFGGGEIYDIEGGVTTVNIYPMMSRSFRANSGIFISF